MASLAVGLALQGVVKERQPAGNHFVVGIEKEDMTCPETWAKPGISRRAGAAEADRLITVSGKA